MEGDYIDANEFLKWRVKARHLITTVCGQQSQHFQMLEQCDKAVVGDTNYGIFRRINAILLAAKEDYEGG